MTDSLFTLRALVTAVNEIITPKMPIFDRYFRPVARMQPTDKLQYDIITSDEAILASVSARAKGTEIDLTGKATVTLEAPRLNPLKFISAADLNAYRKMGSAIAPEMLKNRIALEQADSLNKINRTLEHWATGALRGQVIDKTGTVLVDYDLASTHTSDLTGTALWTHVDSTPLVNLKAYRKLITHDAGAMITGFVAYLGDGVMDALTEHADVRDVLKYTQGTRLTEDGEISVLSKVQLHEYDGSYVNSSGTRVDFIEDGHILIIGLCDQLFACPYSPIVNLDAPNGVGNVNAAGQGQMYFSESWPEKNPSGRWLLTEARPIPVVQRPGALIYKKVV